MIELFVLLVHIITSHMFKFKWLGNVLNMFAVKVYDANVSMDPG